MEPVHTINTKTENGINNFQEFIANLNLLSAFFYNKTVNGQKLALHN